MRVHHRLNKLLLVDKVDVLRAVYLILGVAMVDLIVDSLGQIWLNHSFLGLCIWT